MEWFIPISSQKEEYNGLLMANNSLMRDATIAKILLSVSPQIRSLTVFESPHLSRILVDKLYFLSEYKALDLEAPDFYLLQNPYELKKLYRKDQFIAKSNRPYYLKYIQANVSSNNAKGKVSFYLTHYQFLKSNAKNLDKL